MASDASKFSLCTAALFLIAVLLPAGSHGQTAGLSYSLSPTGEYIFFDRDRDAGLDGGFMYGGEIGIGFGEYLELSGQYLLGQDYRTNFAASGEEYAGLAEFDGRSVDMQRYGGRLQVNLGSAALVPFVSAGSGILQFNPDGLSSTQNIFATLGAGLVYTAEGRYTLSVAGQQMAYRYNPGTAFYTPTELADAGFPDGIDQQNVRIPSLRASLAVHLGGRTPGEMSELDRALLQQFGRDGTGVRVFVEPFYGRIQFNEALGFPKHQNVAGANAGLELGPYVGLRGYYWRGATGEEDVLDRFAEGFEDIAFYGGELNLRFGSPHGQRSLTPYGILGAGYMDVLSGYGDDVPPGTSPPEDSYYATVGAGLEFPLTPQLKLKGDIRSLLMSTEDPADLSSPDNVYGSWMYSAGLVFSVGGRRAERPAEVLEERFVEDERDLVEQEEIRRLQERIETLEQMVEEREIPVEDQALAELRREIDRLERRADPDVEVDDPPTERPAARRTNLSGETVTLPVPEVGEIYIRIGEVDAQQPGAQQPLGQQLSPEAIRSIVQQVVREEITDAGVEADGLTREEIENMVRDAIRQEIAEADVQAADISLSQIEQRLAEEAEDRRALERELAQLRQQLAEARRNGRAPEVIVERDDRGRTIIRDRTGFFGGREIHGILPYTGLRFGHGPAQFMLAVRGDLRQPGGNFRILPEVGVGFGGGRSVNAHVNGAYPVGGQLAAPFEPYVGAGVGLMTNDGISGLRVGLNLMSGVEYPVAGGAAFAEFTTFNFLNTNRILAGYRVRF